MKWVLIVLGVIVGLILLIGICGMLIPKSHVASRKARFIQTPERVWDAITDFQGQTVVANGAPPGRAFAGPWRQGRLARDKQANGTADDDDYDERSAPPHGKSDRGQQIVRRVLDIRAYAHRRRLRANDHGEWRNL